MLDMIQSIQFKANHHPNNLQRKLGKDVKEILKDQHVLVKADKTTSYYKTTPEEYMRLLNKNVTKAYKKTDLNVPYVIATKDKQIAKKLGLDDRIEVSARRDSYIIMKDHKPDFVNNPVCRLINPSKTEIGAISKHLLDDISSKIIQATKVNLWRSTSNVIKWFNTIPEKCQYAFITFDVCEFYPSISEELLMNRRPWTTHQDLQRSPNKTGILLSTRKEHSSTTKTHHGLKRTLTACLM